MTNMPRDIYAMCDGSHGEDSGFWHSTDFKEDGEVRYVRHDLSLAAIAHLMQEKAALEAKVAALEAKVKAHESRIVLV